MPIQAFLLVVLAACAHSTWNILIKRATDSKNLLLFSSAIEALYWKDAWSIAVLMPVGYILVLFAMRMAPVSHVAPIREMSMMIGAYFGIKFLREGHAQRRIFGSALIVIGVAAIAAG